MGVLFLVATIFFVAGEAVYDPVLGSPDYLDSTYPDRMIVISGVLLQLIGVLAIPLIPVFLLPILRDHNEELALGYLVLRTLEATLLIVVAIAMLSLIGVSQRYLEAGGVVASQLHSISSSIRSIGDWAFLLSVGLVFPLGALVLYSLLYGSKLIPRFISVWGLIAAAVLLGGSVLEMFEMFFELSEPLTEAVLATPIAVNEIVLAIWLIAKGFNPTAVTAKPIDAA